MRILLLNHLQNAHQSLKTGRARTLLTMTGVMIGVASIVAILAISSGALSVVNNQIKALDENLIIVRPGKTVDTLSEISRAQPNQKYTTSTLLDSDLVKISKIEHVKYVAPLMILSGAISGDSKAGSDAQIVATTPDLININKLEMRDGIFIEEDSTRNTAIIGTQLSINIFGTENSIGRTAIVSGKPLMVVGVLKRINEPINYNSIDFDNAILVNYEIGKVLNNNSPQIQQINIAVDSIGNIDKASLNIEEIIKINHRGEDDFSVLTRDQIAKPTSQLLDLITGLSTAIAGISLVVGGIGIMNIMLVTVAERTREIGIRKALGANNIDILYQFLIESLAISLFGGALGFILGCMFAFLISTTLTFDPVITWQHGLIALIISLIIGIIFGIYPALRAARKDPIESLYQYH